MVGGKTKILTRFEGRKEVDGSFPKFWTQLIEEDDQAEEVLYHMCTGFIRDEPLCKYSNAVEDKEMMAEMRELWIKALTKKDGIACYTQNPDPNGKPLLAGMNVTCVVRKDDRIEPKTTLLKKIIRTVELLEHTHNPFDTFGIDRHLYALGLYVLPEYRGQGLGLEILKAREPLCLERGIQYTVTAFTATPSQKVAEKCGFKVLAKISYEKMASDDPSLEYPGIQEHTKELKLMYWRF